VRLRSLCSVAQSSSGKTWQGAGTSANMNGNEVLASVAFEMTGHKKAEYAIVDPHDHLNMLPSMNDSYPTAIRVAFILRTDKLIAELEKLAASFRAKGDAFVDIVKMGWTELRHTGEENPDRPADQ
jgi:aspartate ammonia-lyase